MNHLLTNNRVTLFNFTNSFKCNSTTQFSSSLITLIICQLYVVNNNNNTDQSDCFTHMSLLKVEHKVSFFPVLDHASFFKQESLKLNLPLNLLSPNYLLLHATYCASSWTNLKLKINK